jgi:hypothetical protein
MFVSDLWQVSGFLPVPSTNKTDRHDITEILLNTINQTKPTKGLFPKIHEYITIDCFSRKTFYILVKGYRQKNKQDCVKCAMRLRKAMLTIQFKKENGQVMKCKDWPVPLN